LRVCKLPFSTGIKVLKKKEFSMASSLVKGITGRILKDFSDGILAIDVKTRKIIEINPATSDLVGYREDELIGKDVLTLHPIAHRKRIRKLINDLKFKHLPYLADIPFIRKNGEIFFVDIAPTTIMYNGSVIGIGFLRDRRKVINKSCDWNLLYEQLAEMVECGICVICKKKFVYVNKALVDLLGGKSSLQFIDKDAISIVPDQDRESITCICENLIRGAIPVSIIKQKIKTLNGEEIDCLIKSVRTTFTGEIAVHSIIRRVDPEKDECLNNLSGLTETQKSIPELTKKEVEVLCLIVGGKNTKEIAHELNIAYHTVMVHKHNIMRKLNLKSVADLVRFAIKNGFVRLD